MKTIANDLAPWRARAAAAGVVPGSDEDLRLADEAEMEAIRDRQAANRNAAYARHRPSRYEGASYEMLRPEQNPNGLVTAWLERGPRALVIAGPARTGKTTAAYAVANDAHARGDWVMAWSSVGLSAALKPDGEPMAFNYAITCSLLVLDDLGRERVTDWWLEQLHRIVDDRCANQRRLIVTTNSAATPDDAYEQLVTRYGDPIVERLVDDGGVVVLDGPAVRRVVTEW